MAEEWPRLHKALPVKHYPIGLGAVSLSPYGGDKRSAFEMDASGVLTFLSGAAIGGCITYFVLWYYARKIDALVPGGLKAWDLYDQSADQASPTGRVVTE